MSTVDVDAPVGDGTTTSEAVRYPESDPRTEPFPRPRPTFLDHRGVGVLLVDYSHQRDPAATRALFRENQAVLDAEPEGSVRLLADVTGMRHDVTLSNALREGAARSGPRRRAMAVIGVTGVMQVIHRGVNRLLGRAVRDFPTCTEALDWLAAQ